MNLLIAFSQVTNSPKLWKKCDWADEGNELYTDCMVVKLLEVSVRKFQKAIYGKRRRRKKKEEEKEKEEVEEVEEEKKQQHKDNVDDEKKEE